MMYHDTIFAGFGGQGILMIGDILARAGLREGRHVTWMPAYGVEMRGGTANCTVVVSEKRIGSPIPSHPHSMIAMNKPSLIKFAPQVCEGGIVVYNGSFMEPEDLPNDAVQAVRVNANDEALELGNIKVASMIALGALVQKTGVVKHESLKKVLDEILPPSKKKFLEINMKALDRGRDIAS